MASHNIKQRLNSIFNKVCIFLLILSLVLIILKLYKSIHKLYHPYMLGDWLINYEDGGFKRRGLSGSFFFFIQDITNLKLSLLVWGFQSLFNIYFFYFLIKIISLQNKWFYTILFFTPVTLLFWIWDPESLGRKDIMILALFAHYIYLLLKNSFSSLYKYTIFSFFISVSILFHELCIFYLPYFIFAISLCNQHKSKQKLIYSTLIISIPPILAAASILLFGKMDFSYGETLNILHSRGISYISDALINFKDDPSIHNLYFNYTYLFPLSYLLVVIYLYETTFNKKKIVFWILIIAIICSIPLFLKAIDWGRWIFIHAILSAILLALLENTNKHIHTHIKYIYVIFIILGILLFKMPLTTPKVGILPSIFIRTLKLLSF